MVKFCWNITVEADDEIFLELAQASDVSSGFLTANAMATMIYDIPFAWSRYTKVGYPATWLSK
jgi:hypothetical protein